VLSYENEGQVALLKALYGFNDVSVVRGHIAIDRDLTVAFFDSECGIVSSRTVIDEFDILTGDERDSEKTELLIGLGITQELWTQPCNRY
jgi:ATPase subunit of ABC transporter with duplicated ATPase domains